ncbi:cell filamentation protein Fic [Candidatus Saccharibacteria bacterium]|nr:MAG: cell filamentation protein Fic [Candidatus Saccharibacteria bacterium]
MPENSKKSDFLLYTSPDGEVRVEVFFQDETVWLTQKRMGELFDVEVPTINYHIKEVYDAKELSQDPTIRKIRIVQNEGGREVERETLFYSLDVIISVGYRVNSHQATQFRIWATRTLRNFIIKGYALDDERLKNGTHFGKDYFDELLEKIREIRASERRFYQKITDIYSTAADYDPHAPVTQKFFATVQNKLHFAIHGQTAPELIASQADAAKPHMGLKNWKNSPAGKILKSDTTVGKNYLNERQLTELNRVVSMYLDFAENQAERGLVMTMADWASRLDAFLQFNEYEILQNPGKVSRLAAEKLAHEQYKKFRPLQDKTFESDFDRAIKKIQQKKDHHA